MKAGVALGSNVGDRLANLQEARLAVAALSSDPAAVTVSAVFETEPVDCEPGTPGFLNAVMEIEHAGPPIALLDALQAIEAEMGRPSKRPRNAPRTIDLDILYFGNLALRSDELMVPHPRLHTRRFVLEPLSRIRPNLILPGHEIPVAEMLANLPAQPAVKLVAATW